jgi:hypothetical protein
MGVNGSKIAGNGTDDGTGQGGNENSISKSKQHSHSHGSISSTTGAFQRSATTEVVKLMFPVYYVDERITPEELTLAKLKWNMILNNTSEYFLQNQGTPGFEQPSCISFFYDCFYARFFDVHPVSGPFIVDETVP